MQKIIPQLAVVDGDSVERFECRNVVGGSPLGCELFRAYRGGVQKGLHHAAHCEFELLGGGGIGAAEGLLLPRGGAAPEVEGDSQQEDDGGEDES